MTHHLAAGARGLEHAQPPPRGAGHPGRPTAADAPSSVPPAGVVILRVAGAWRPVRVSRDRWVTVEQAARALRVRTSVVRERARREGVVSVGEGRPGSPRLYRLADLAPELALSARPRPSQGVAVVG